jgi:mono/diheme cytochrome c family protein
MQSYSGLGIRDSGFGRKRFAAAAFVCAVLAAGCDESLESVAGPTPTLAPTLSSIQRDIFQAGDSSGRPSCASCHNPNGGAFRAVALDLSTSATYDSLVGVASRQKAGAVRVVPGDPANSYLIHKLEGRSDIAGVRMPIRGPYLTDGQIAIIKRWIELGARRD